MICFVDETGSTQDDAKAAAAAGAAHGYAVCAKRQTLGRGRLGRSFLSGHDGLWLSVVVRPAKPLPMTLAKHLPLCVGVRIMTLLRARGASVHIKWPNDLLIPAHTIAPRLGAFRKIGGVLVEAVDVKAGGLDVAVVGVGINYVIPDDDDVKDIAAAYTGDTALLPQRACDAIADAIFDVDGVRFANILTEARTRSSMIGHRVTVDTVDGIATDIDDDGALVVVSDDGVSHTITAGEVMAAAPR